MEREEKGKECKMLLAEEGSMAVHGRRGKGLGIGYREFGPQLGRYLTSADEFGELNWDEIMKNFESHGKADCKYRAVD